MNGKREDELGIVRAFYMVFLRPGELGSIKKMFRNSKALRNTEYEEVNKAFADALLEAIFPRAIWPIFFIVICLPGGVITLFTLIADLAKHRVGTLSAIFLIAAVLACWIVTLSCFRYLVKIGQKANAAAYDKACEKMGKKKPQVQKKKKRAPAKAAAKPAPQPTNPAPQSAQPTAKTGQSKPKPSPAAAAAPNPQASAPAQPQTIIINGIAFPAPSQKK